MRKRGTKKEDVTAESGHGAIFDAANDAIFINDIETGRVVDANKKACEMFCYPKEEILGLSVADLSVNEPPYSQQNAAKLFKKASDGHPQVFEWLARDKAARLFWVELNLKRAVIGGKYRLLAVVRDVTDRKKAEEALRRSEVRFRNVAENARDWIWEVDVKGRYTYASPVVEKVLGYKPEEVLGKHFYHFFHPADRLALKKAALKAFSRREPFRNFLNRNVHRNGHVIFLETSGVPVVGDEGRLIGYIGVDHDVTELKQAEEELRLVNKELVASNKRLKRLTLKDSQTGLYNHHYLEEAIEAEFQRAKRHYTPLAVMMMDIDYFKSVNDVYGHKFGDIVLKQLTDYLKNIVRRYDIIIRFGGEEFIIIFPGINKQKALLAGRRLLDAVNLYNFGNKEHVIKLKLSIAVTSYPDDNAAKGMVLVSLADRILNKVKDEGGNKVYSLEDMTGIRHALREEAVEPTDIKVLRERIERLTKQGKRSVIEAISAFAKTIELRDHYTGEHVESTVRYATEIARGLGLSQEEMENIRQASTLHDLGKIGISDKILLKKAKLTEKEFEEIKKHPQIAADIIRPIQFMHDIIPLVLYHHERWDGKGYPAGLKAEEIPIGARIIAVADVYQALTSNRPYRKAYSKKEAVGIIRRGTGTQFDPTIIRAFLKVLKKEKAI